MKPIHIVLLIVITAFAFAMAKAQSGWYRQHVPSDGGLLDVQFIDSHNGIVVGGESDSLGVAHPLILQTTNGGASWSRQLLPMEGGLSGVFRTDVENATAVGWSGQLIWFNLAGGPLIVHTTDGGLTWASQLRDSGYTLNSVCFTDVNTGTAVGWDGGVGGGRILRTTDGGNNWTHQVSGTDNCLRKVCFTDRLTGTIAGWGIILRTTDGGNSWMQTSGMSDVFDCISFTDANTGTVVGEHVIKPGFGPVPVIFHTTDGGTTWTHASGAMCALPYGVSFGDAMTGFVVGGGARGAQSALMNGTVGERRARQADSSMRAIQALGVQVGRPSSFMASRTVNAMLQDSVISRTTDGGATWIPQTIGPTSSLSTELEAVSFSDAYNGAAVGYEQDSLGSWRPLILRTTTGGIVSTGGGHKNQIPNRVLLFQNYPNPFNPTTTIGYSVGGTRHQASGVSDVRLSVYDILGREVAVLVDEKKAPGSYEVKFDARLPGGQGSNLASGVYVYRLQAGEFIQAKKLVILK